MKHTAGIRKTFLVIVFMCIATINTSTTSTSESTGTVSTTLEASTSISSSTDAVSTTLETTTSTAPSTDAVSTTLKACDNPEDLHGSYSRITAEGPFAMWTLKCNVGYAPADATLGVLKRCDGSGGFLDPIPANCIAKPGCTKDSLQKIIGNDASKPITCFNNSQDTLQEGRSCHAICPPNYKIVGYFRCSEEDFIGESGCLAENAGSLKLDQATGIASKYRMSLTNCIEGYTANSCASLLQAQVEATLDTRTFRLDVQDLSGRYISSTSQVTFDAGPPARLLSASALEYDVSVEAAVFPEDGVGEQTFAELSGQMMVYMQDMGTSGTHFNNLLKQKLSSISPPIDLQSTMVKVAPRPFGIDVAVDKVRGTITNAIDLPPPVWPTTAAPREDESPVQLWLVIVLSAGAVVGMLLAVSAVRCYCWYHERLYNS